MGETRGPGGERGLPKTLRERRRDIGTGKSSEPGKSKRRGTQKGLFVKDLGTRARSVLGGERRGRRLLQGREGGEGVGETTA